MIVILLIIQISGEILLKCHHINVRFGIIKLFEVHESQWNNTRRGTFPNFLNFQERQKKLMTAYAVFAVNTKCHNHFIIYL